MYPSATALESLSLSLGPLKTALFRYLNLMTRRHFIIFFLAFFLFFYVRYTLRDQNISPGRISTGRFFDESFWCKSNPFLASWTSSDFSKTVSGLIKWRHSIVRNSQEASFIGTTSLATSKVYGGLPEVASLGSWKMYGTDHGGKWISGLSMLQYPCIIYSLGSDGDFSFEEHVSRSSSCEVHTLDCTLTPEKFPKNLPPRVFFHPLCLGDEEGLEAKYRTLSSIMTQLGHKHVDVLKMDIEGFEYRVVEALFKLFLTKGSDVSLPSQLLMEQHSVTYVTDLPWGGGLGLNSGEMAILWVNLVEMGYVLVHREDQSKCPTCTELVAVRAFC